MSLLLLFRTAASSSPAPALIRQPVYAIPSGNRLIALTAAPRSGSPTK